MNLTAPTSLVARRGAVIQRSLRPLTRHNMGPAWQQVANAYGLVIAAHDGSSASDDFASWRFPSLVPFIRCSYYERWFRVEKSDSWYLDRAYLHLYRFDAATRKETEFVLLHCDPNEAESEAHSRYKRSPHLHISLASDPFPHAHISLNLTDIEATIGSLDGLGKAFSSAIMMLCEEVLPLYQLEGD